MTIVAAGVELSPETGNETSRGNRVIFGSDSARRLLERHGLIQLDRLFELGQSARARHVGRCVYSRTVEDSNGLPVKLYIKLQEGRRRLWPRMTDLRTGQLFQTLAEREWSGIERLKQLGIPVPERMGLFNSTPWSLWFRAAVIVREVRPPFSIDELVSNGRWAAIARSDQDQILENVIATLRRIHGAGLGWRGSSSRHFFPERQPNGQWTSWLIDCEGVHRFASRKTVEQNYAKLVKAFRESGSDADTLGRLEKKISLSMGVIEDRRSAA
ncbi:MAG: hypothetical protein IT428_30690 [Planctomycetaceae bacterium]|nr:hypothetical protein [Planctomycetaceae bacterium]